MRLINTTSLEIVEFFDNDIPKYAILSHTWGDGDTEVSFSDFRRGDPLTKAKPGYQKIENACKEASKRSLHYVWVDTCCIDKTSSAELSEAINSMFQWYEEAEICFAYLADATSATALEPSGASRWFTRGWTLQELLAPSKLEFFDEDWGFIANRQDAAEAISLTTGIDQVFLTDTYVGSRRKLLASASGATKMSWAAARKTKRKEDIAYCLLGIFDVNMPLIYGEGMRAFTRLQQEILRSSFDPTLLAWNRADLGIDIMLTSPRLDSSPRVQPSSGTAETSQPIGSHATGTSKLRG
ncbi:hypothetical protein CkaCkLH20_09118 [Colletotrichum karsti]|uniref:Vegetative incompatibility protein HET-E-1 n=1 Tax=Colletotrichum karsti TaxID=1095194 RepID=A0A9P6I010_9PEZI|nr:uncharacterized protein CkaCkLH20_09118 [Colletotrichum karsti]KAF9873305.1 hypothetical protein CkaCkLH20_09118 [Colletotrichum karsti]